MIKNPKKGYVRRRDRIIIHHTQNPSDSIDAIAEQHKVTRTSVAEILDKFYAAKRQLYIVASLLKDNTFFAFNGITEREFHTGKDGFVTENEMFSIKEKEELRRLGFKINNYE